LKFNSDHEANSRNFLNSEREQEVINLAIERVLEKIESSSKLLSTSSSPSYGKELCELISASAIALKSLKSLVGNE